MGAVDRRAALHALDGLVAELAAQAAEGAVVADEQHQRVVAQLQLVELVDEPADQLVHVADHVGEVAVILVLVLALDRRVPPVAVRRRLVREVRQDHRVVEQERLVFVPLHEVDREVADQVRPVLAVLVVDRLRLVLEAGVGVARREPRVLPQHVLVEAELLRQLRDPAELPLAADPGLVAGVSEQVAERHLASLELAEADVVAHVVLAGHHLHPRRRAERLHVRVGEARAARRERVQVGRLVAAAAVAGQALVAEVVGEDHDDVRPPLRAEHSRAQERRDHPQRARHSAGHRAAASRHCCSVGTSASRTKRSWPWPKNDPGATTIPCSRQRSA